MKGLSKGGKGICDAFQVLLLLIDVRCAGGESRLIGDNHLKVSVIMGFPCEGRGGGALPGINLPFPSEPELSIPSSSNSSLKHTRL